MIDTSKIIELIQNNIWLAPLLSMLAGFITSFTPCCLFSIPLVIGYVDGIGEKKPKRAFLLSLTFAAGTAVTFIVLGVLAATAGLFLNHLSDFWHIVSGIALILIAFKVWEVFPGKHHHAPPPKRKGFMGAFLAGIAGGLFSTPCSAPILVAILALISGSGKFFLGILLMIAYSFGHNILVLIAGTSAGFVSNLKSSGKYKVLSNILKFLMGALIFFIGVILLWHSLE